MSQTLLNKIKNRKIKVAVMGLGYVGLPLSLLYAEKKCKVIGYDPDKNKIAALKKGISYIDDIKNSSVKSAISSRFLKPTHNQNDLKEADIIVICVPTPLNRLKNPDLSYVLDASGIISSLGVRNKLIILESTTYPGTTDEVICPILEGEKFKVGKDFHLCFSPERVDPGNKVYQTNNIPKVLGGVTSACTKAGKSFYSQFIPEVVTVSSARTAEMTKLLENTFRIVNIGLINELAMSAKSLGVNIWEAVDAAKTKPFGYMPFYPGPGIGGHCIGIDPLYLSWKAKLHGQDLQFIELARTVNAEMPDFVVHEIGKLLNEHFGKAYKKAKVLILGVTYKKNISDLRESPALEILDKLKENGCQVDYHDPYAKSFSHEGRRYKSVGFSPSTLKKYDLCVITTDHDSFDYQVLVKSAKLIFDTRNRLQKFKSKKIARL